MSEGALAAARGCIVDIEYALLQDTVLFIFFIIMMTGLQKGRERLEVLLLVRKNDMHHPSCAVVVILCIVNDD